LLNTKKLLGGEESGGLFLFGCAIRSDQALGWAAERGRGRDIDTSDLFLFLFLFCCFDTRRRLISPLSSHRYLSPLTSHLSRKVIACAVRVSKDTEWPSLARSALSHSSISTIFRSPAAAFSAFHPEPWTIPGALSLELSAYPATLHLPCRLAPYAHRSCLSLPTPAVSAPACSCLPGCFLFPPLHNHPRLH
jgi:hypothetical protein